MARSSDAGHSCDSPCHSCPSAAREDHLPSNRCCLKFCLIWKLISAQRSFKSFLYRSLFSSGVAATDLFTPGTRAHPCQPQQMPPPLTWRQGHIDSCASFTSTFTPLVAVPILHPFPHLILLKLPSPVGHPSPILLYGGFAKSPLQKSEKIMIQMNLFT